MPAKESNPADYAAMEFLSTKKEARRQAAVCFLADRLLAEKVTGYWEKIYRL